MTDEETIVMLGDAIHKALMTAANIHPDPVQMMHCVPHTLAGMAGSHVLQMSRSLVLGDGETDKLLNELAKSMKDHADPGKNAPARGVEKDLRHMRRPK